METSRLVLDVLSPKEATSATGSMLLSTGTDSLVSCLISPDLLQAFVASAVVAIELVADRAFFVIILMIAFTAFDGIEGRGL